MHERLRTDVEQTSRDETAECCWAGWMDDALWRIETHHPRRKFYRERRHAIGMALEVAKFKVARQSRMPGRR
jgi:hypothetical protein